MNTFAQIVSITAMNLRSIPLRLGSSLVIVIGIAGVVAVLVSMLAMATGFRHTVTSGARSDRALVMRIGSVSELSSFITRDNAATIADAPGVKKDGSGHPISSPEVLVMVNAIKKGQTTSANVVIRGVSPRVFDLRPELHIIEGRAFNPSLHEVIVGKAARAQFQDLEIGSHVLARGVEWTIVGVFENAGDSHESEMLGDADTIMAANRRGSFSAVSVMLESEESFTAFKDALTTNPALSVDVLQEPEYYARQSEQLSKVLYFVTYFVGSVMAVGAVFGALNTMYSAVSARSVEIATLRAIGFGNTAIVVSVMTEAIVLAGLGGALGAMLAWIGFNGHTVSTLGGNFSQIVFPLTVTGHVVVLGFLWATSVGLIGGLLPALRAARLPIATALKAQ